MSVMVGRSMNLLSIQSHVAYGHVGNAAAVFPLQRLGIEVWPVHTVQFSNHTGYGQWQGRVFDAAMIRDVAQGIGKRGVFECTAQASAREILLVAAQDEIAAPSRKFEPEDLGVSR